VPPADAVEFVPPSDGVAVDSLPSTPQPQDLAPKPEPAWYESLFPLSSENADAPAYAPRALDAAWRDISSLPGRAYASMTRPEGESYSEAMARTEAPQDASGAWSVTDNILRDPLLAPSVAAPALRLPAWLASAAPAWLRGATAGVELGANAGSRSMQAVRAAAKATPGGAAIAGLSQSDRLARGEAPNIRRALGTFAAAPVMAGAGPMLEGLGAGLKRGGVQALRQMVKPTTTELEGFYRAMDAGLLPEAAGMFTMTPGGAGERYIGRMKTRTEAAYAPAIAEAERTGATVNMDQVMRDASRSLRGEVDEGKLALGEDDISNVNDWLGAKLLYRDAPGREALRQANIPYQGRYVPQIGKKDVVQQFTERGAPIMYKGSQALGPFGEPLYERVTVPRIVGQKDIISGFEKLPDYYEPIPDVTRPVIPAHRLKSAMQDAAYPGRDPKAVAPQAGTRAGAKGADRAIRAQIAEVSPAYAAADAQVAPWYAGADAFQRAADVRGGNYALDIMAPLVGGAAGSQNGVASGLGGALGTAALVRYLRSPALARHLWEAGRAAQATGRGVQAAPTLGSMLFQSQTDNAR